MSDSKLSGHNPRHVMLELRHAFDGQDVVVKNLMLRKANDCIEQLLGVAQTSLERIAELQYEAGMYQSLYENAINRCERISIYCTANMDRDRNHRMALDFVREIANEVSAVPSANAQASLRSVAERYMTAVKRLSEDSGYNRLTYFEAPIIGMPTEEARREAHARWLELNNAGVELTKALALPSQDRA